jgi:hypothetical protein
MTAPAPFPPSRYPLAASALQAAGINAALARIEASDVQRDWRAHLCDLMAAQDNMDPGYWEDGR